MFRVGRRLLPVKPLALTHRKCPDRAKRRAVERVFLVKLTTEGIGASAPERPVGYRESVT
jgi:hypothetical protein